MSDTAGHRGPLRTSEVLRDELEAIFGPDAVRGLNDAMAAAADEDDRLELAQIAASRQQPVALCLSGGGIRSASFALGVLQALAGAGQLTRFHYLSTVSGGGYIGSWLSAWLHWAGGSRPVIEGLSSRGTDDAEPAPIRHIRQYSNYLTPRLGLMSSDTWAAVAICGRNLLLNWMILFPALWLLVLFPKIASAAAQLARANPLPELFGFLVGALISLLVIASTWYTTANRVSDRSRCFFGLNAQTSFLLADLLPLVLAATAFTWVVNRPQEYVGWLIRDYSGLAIVAGGALALYAVGFLLARWTYRPEHAPRPPRACPMAARRGGLAVFRAGGRKGPVVGGRRLYRDPRSDDPDTGALHAGSGGLRRRRPGGGGGDEQAGHARREIAAGRPRHAVFPRRGDGRPAAVRAVPQLQPARRHRTRMARPRRRMVYRDWRRLDDRRHAGPVRLGGGGRGQCARRRPARLAGAPRRHFRPAGGAARQKLRDIGTRAQTGLAGQPDQCRSLGGRAACSAR